MTNEMLDRFPQKPISKEKIWTLSKQRRFPLNAAAVKRRIVTIVTTHQNAGLCPKSRSFCCCESLKKRQSCALNGRLKKLIIKLQWWRKQSDSTEARRTRQNTAWSCGEEDECEIWGNILSVALSKLWRASARHKKWWWYSKGWMQKLWQQYGSKIHGAKTWSSRCLRTKGTGKCLRIKQNTAWRSKRLRWNRLRKSGIRPHALTTGWFIQTYMRGHRQDRSSNGSALSVTFLFLVRFHSDIQSTKYS